MWYFFSLLLTVSPVILGLGAVVGHFVADEFYEYPLYDNYED
ncbi:hypothetical protein SCOR_35430 [Sulfidibacter corallicola]|nr:hypothetical protein [Sulfidibacter corallicola]